MSIYGYPGMGTIGGPSYVPLSHVMTRPFGISSTWRTGPSSIFPGTGTVGGPSYVPLSHVMTRPFGISPTWRTGPTSPCPGNSFGNFGFGLRTSSFTNNPYTANSVRMNFGGLQMGTHRGPFGSATGIYNPMTGTRFGQLTTGNGVKTALAGDIYNFSQSVEKNPFATRTTTRFEDDQYRYTVRNTRSSNWFA